MPEEAFHGRKFEHPMLEMILEDMLQGMDWGWKIKFFPLSTPGKVAAKQLQR